MPLNKKKTPESTKKGLEPGGKNGPDKPNKAKGGKNSPVRSFFVLRTGKSDTPDKQHGAVRDGQKGAWISVAIIHLVG